MTEHAVVFRDRFNRIVDSLENATGNKQIAWLSALSIVTGEPLLIESKTDQTKLARAVASAIHGVFDFTHGFEIVAEHDAIGRAETRVQCVGFGNHQVEHARGLLADAFAFRRVVADAEQTLE